MSENGQGSYLMLNRTVSDVSIITPEELARLGSGQVVYVREIEAQDIANDFPTARNLPPESKLFVLHAADGVPIMLSDDRDSVLANARENSLETVSLH